MSTLVSNQDDRQVKTLKELRAADLMQSHVYTVQETDTLLHAARQMSEYNIRHVIVVDDQQRPVGVFSERDMLRYIASCTARKEVVPGSVPVSKIMTPSPVTVSPSTSLQELASLLAARRIGCVPVVNSDSKLVGIISIVDVLEAVGKSAALS